MLPFWVEFDIGYVDYRALQDRPAGPEAPAGGRRVQSSHLLEGFWGEVVAGHMMDQLAVEPNEPAEESVAQLHGALDDRVEHRLHVGRRAADDPQDVAGRRLLLLCLRLAR